MISELDIYQIIISWRLISRFRARRRGPESLDRESGQVAVILPPRVLPPGQLVGFNAGRPKFFTGQITDHFSLFSYMNSNREIHYSDSLSYSFCS